MRVRLELAYDGAGFRGWARQEGLRTVEGELRAVLERMARRPVDVTAAGRTDAGVHARGQVAHFDLETADLARMGVTRGPGPWPEALARRLNSALPPDARVLGAGEAEAEFDARFSALWREYRYRIADAPAAQDPLERSFTWWTRPLDAAAMGQAGAALLGEHDFLPFAIPRPGASTVRTVLALRCERPAEGRIDLTVRADAFCHRMVRFIVGALTLVGSGRRPPGWVGEVLAGGVRDPAAQAVPPHGLTLERVAYPAGAEALAAQSSRARVFRGAR
ncbi:MAG: tRNA pseudouridine(38-40) synthase TruA [Bifidobacteriaceae bacterium]|jgi:tRNA pseudouridine38-40 synthase|nr:tRNA pseudouridine(38-40) synthase TruA [Bifidobacteriaceae bacterium]